MKKKLDYKLIALFEMAKKHNEEMSKYAKELKQHIGDEDADDYIWDFILEPKYDVKDLIKEIAERKEKKVNDVRNKTKKH